MRVIDLTAEAKVILVSLRTGRQNRIDGVARVRAVPQWSFLTYEQKVIQHVKFKFKYLIIGAAIIDIAGSDCLRFSN